MTSSFGRQLVRLIVLLGLALPACTGPHDEVVVGIDKLGVPVTIGGAFTANVSFAQVPVAVPAEPVDVRLDWSQALFDRRRTAIITGAVFMIEHRVDGPTRLLGSFAIVNDRLTKSDFLDGDFAHDLRDSRFPFSIQVVVKAIDTATGKTTCVVYESLASATPERNVSESKEHKLTVVNWCSDP